MRDEESADICYRNYGDEVFDIVNYHRLRFGRIYGVIRVGKFSAVFVFLQEGIEVIVFLEFAVLYVRTGGNGTVFDKDDVVEVAYAAC